jgi:hypothetical protein
MSGRCRWKAASPCLSIFGIDDNMIGALEHAAYELSHVVDDQD